MAVLSGVLLAIAVLLWSSSPRLAHLDRALVPPAAGGTTTEPPGGGRFIEAIRVGWRSDPADLLRGWAQRRRASTSTDGVLAVLEGFAPALEAGLPPAVAAGLAGEALGPGLDPIARQLVANLSEAGEHGVPLAPVWRACGVETGSADIGFVAAAWQLSELTGAPLADAVQRAVASLRDARERTRRVQVAVAGPRATVVVLTVLPLTGPAFGLACGVPPAELYLGTPLSAAAAIGGILLMLVGRFWCGRLIASVTVPLLRSPS